MTEDGFGIFCEVCRSRGEPREVYAFEPDEERIAEIEEKSAWAESRKREKVRKERKKAREAFYEHWKDEHW